MKKFALLIASTVLSVLFLEGCVRTYEFGWSSLLPWIMDSVHGIGRSGLVQASSCKELVYELKPNLNTYFKKTRFSTNAQGLRDKHYGRTKPADAFRVAVVGDSFTLPAGVSIDNAYHSLLEKRLGREYPAVRIEFINFGVGGYDLQQYAAVIEHKVLSYDPDLIVIGFCTVNDFFRYAEFETFLRQNKPYKVLPVNHPFRHWHSLAKLQETIPNIERFFSKTSQTHPPPAPPPQLSPEQRRYVNATFDRISTAASARNIGVLITALGIEPLLSDKADFLRQASGKHDFLFIDATQGFSGKAKERYYIYRSDSHPDAEANRIFSDEIYPAIKAILAARFGS